MGINLAGYDLPLVDIQEGLIDDWLDRWLPTSDLRVISEWPSATFSQNRHTVPLVNYSRPIKPRISTWYYPTGASRWGFGLFLCNADRLALIADAMGASDGGDTSSALVLTDGTNTKEFTVYMLPPRLIGQDVYVLPLVDSRWFWQFVTPGGITFTDTNAWNDIINLLQDPLPLDTIIADTPSPYYLYPNPWFYSDNGFQPVGPLLDATLHSIGFRLIDNNDGDWYAASATTSVQNHALNINLGGNFMIAPQSSPLVIALPDSVMVSFRYYKNGVVEKNWAALQYPVTNEATAYGIETAAAATLTLRSTALADYTSGSPSNNVTLANLANQITSDFYALNSYPVDVSMPGITPWVNSGIYDYFEFCMGEATNGGEAFRTRIHGAPHNMILPEMFHWDATTWEYGSVISGILNGTLAANGTAAMKVAVASGVPIIYSNGALPPYPADSAYTLTVTDIHNAGFASGKRVTVMQMDAFNSRGSNQALGTWIVIAGQC